MAKVGQRMIHFFKLLQGFFLVFIFSLTGFLLHYSYSDWDKFPILTTIESVTRPVAELQFPTVTVCPDQHNLPRPWDYVEKLGDFALFEQTCPEEMPECKSEKLYQW